MIGQLGIHADQEKLRLNLSGIRMLDRDEIETRAKDGVDPIVAGKVCLKVEQHLVGDSVLAPLAGGISLFDLDEVVDALKAVQRQAADTDGE